MEPRFLSLRTTRDRIVDRRGGECRHGLSSRPSRRLSSLHTWSAFGALGTNESTICGEEESRSPCRRGGTKERSTSREKRVRNTESSSSSGTGDRESITSDEWRLTKGSSESLGGAEETITCLFSPMPWTA